MRGGAGELTETRGMSVAVGGAPSHPLSHYQTLTDQQTAAPPPPLPLPTHVHVMMDTYLSDTFCSTVHIPHIHWIPRH